MIYIDHIVELNDFLWQQAALTSSVRWWILDNSYHEL